MREIKFRGWDIKHRIMEYEPSGDFYGPDAFYLQLNYVVEDLQTKYILMQYSGLKDKDGKGIYEGDIVRIVNWASDYGKAEGEIFRGVIHYIDWMGAFELRDFDPEESLSRHDKDFESLYYYHCDPDYYIEVLGNIYENPGLLDDLSNQTNNKKTPN